MTNPISAQNRADLNFMTDCMRAHDFINELNTQNGVTLEQIQSIERHITRIELRGEQLRNNRETDVDGAAALFAQHLFDSAMGKAKEIFRKHTVNITVDYSNEEDCLLVYGIGGDWNTGHPFQTRNFCGEFIRDIRVPKPLEQNQCFEFKIVKQIALEKIWQPGDNVKIYSTNEVMVINIGAISDLNSYGFYVKEVKNDEVNPMFYTNNNNNLNLIDEAEYSESHSPNHTEAEDGDSENDDDFPVFSPRPLQRPNELMPTNNNNNSENRIPPPRLYEFVPINNNNNENPVSPRQGNEFENDIALELALAMSQVEYEERITNNSNQTVSPRVNEPNHNNLLVTYSADTIPALIKNRAEEIVKLSNAFREWDDAPIQDQRFNCVLSQDFMSIPVYDSTHPNALENRNQRHHMDTETIEDLFNRSETPTVECLTCKSHNLSRENLMIDVELQIEILNYLKDILKK